MISDSFGSGCWLSDPLNNYFGRRGTIFFSAAFCLFSVIGSGLTQNWYQLFITRILLGMTSNVRVVCCITNACEQESAWAPKLRPSLSSARRMRQPTFVVGLSCAGRWSVTLNTCTSLSNVLFSVDRLWHLPRLFCQSCRQGYRRDCVETATGIRIHSRSAPLPWSVFLSGKPSLVH